MAADHRATAYNWLGNEQDQQQKQQQDRQPLGLLSESSRNVQQSAQGAMQWNGKKAPGWLKHGGKQLYFVAYFIERLNNSPNEEYRVRKVQFRCVSCSLPCNVCAWQEHGRWCACITHVWLYLWACVLSHRPYMCGLCSTGVGMSCMYHAMSACACGANTLMVPIPHACDRACGHLHAARMATI